MRSAYPTRSPFSSSSTRCSSARANDAQAISAVRNDRDSHRVPGPTGSVAATFILRGADSGLRCAAGPARKQFVPLVARLGDTFRLDVTETPNRFGYRRYLDGERKIVPRQAGKQ